MSIFLHKAIREIYPNAININGDTQETITAWDNDGNNVAITNWETVNAKATELQISYNQEQDTLKTNKVSAYRKLSMTDAEILAVDKTLEDYL